ncbi:TPA_asm: hypothetical protein [Powellomyces chytrid fungus MELD virus 3]|nr:TPA_asm: hypothetical protein [Powellomyces chytrid fungus MELD virus 3]
MNITLSEQELEDIQLGQEVFQEIMDKFAAGSLTYMGRGGHEMIVTNPKQAYAMATAISERAVRKAHSQQSDHDRLG